MAMVSVAPAARRRSSSTACDCLHQGPVVVALRVGELGDREAVAIGLVGER